MKLSAGRAGLAFVLSAWVTFSGLLIWGGLQASQQSQEVNQLAAASVWKPDAVVEFTQNNTTEKLTIPSWRRLDDGNIWAHVWKQHGLDPNYQPELANLEEVKVGKWVEDKRLRPQALNNLKPFAKAAEAAGHPILITSAYRSYADQEKTRKELARTNGQLYADEFVAEPGKSEHQLGLAVDFSSYTEPCMEKFTACRLDKASAEWLAAHAHEYGFILRYPEGKQAITGVAPESWHFRYVGKKVAKEMKTLKIKTLEDYLGVTDGAGRKVATPLYYQLINNDTLKKVKLFNIAGRNYLLLNDFMELASDEHAMLYIESHDENQYILSTVKPETELVIKKLVLKPQKSGLRTAVPIKSNLKLNGIELKSKAYFIDNNLYISLGDFAQNLGYQVKLDKKEKQLGLEWVKETAFTKGVVSTEPVV